MTTDSSSDTPGLVTRPPIFLLAAIVLAVALEWIAGIALLPAPGFASVVSWIGVVILAAGAYFAVGGSREFTRAGTNVDPMKPALKLVTSGPYRFTRNPMYLGMVLFLLGLSLMFSLEWGIVLTVVLWIVFDRYVVAREEAYLTRKFGEPYREFLGRTRRWI
jgi:protein-S-isoprenylcysteine O-methyltransferase Ste14